MPRLDAIAPLDSYLAQVDRVRSLTPEQFARDLEHITPLWITLRVDPGV
ncbi:hypothetical protein [Nocardioides sp.]